MTTQTSRLLTVKEAASALHCSAMHIYRLIHAKQLAVVDIAAPGSTRTKWRITREELDRFIASA